MKIIIGWCSDSHLDYNQYGKPQRRKDFSYSLMRTVDDMIEQGVDAIIHTGDIYNSNRPSSEAVQDIQHLHHLLVAKGKFFYLIRGDHDWCNPPWTDILIPNQRGGIVLIDAYPRIKVGDVTIKGYTKLSREALLKEFAEADLKDINILMLHQMVKEFIGFPSPTAISVDEIPDIFQLVAVGDIHIDDIRQRPMGGWIGYPGSTEMCSSSEDPKKVWRKLTFVDRELQKIEAVPIHSRPVLQWDVKTDADLTKYLDEFDQLEVVLKKVDPREPMIFVKFPTTMPGVLDRIKQKLDPEKYIIVPQPVYVESDSSGLPVPITDDGSEMTVQDILQLKVPKDDALFQIASQLLNPDIDAKVALNSFVEARLAPVKVDETECP
jgi:DNA repair exonuclease SbcCD nuclease subunit